MKKLQYKFKKCNKFSVETFVFKIRFKFRLILLAYLNDMAYCSDFKVFKLAT